MERFPDKNWNWREICYRPNLSIEWFKFITDKENIVNISSSILINPHLKIEMIDKIENLEIDNTILHNKKLN